MTQGIQGGGPKPPRLDVREPERGNAGASTPSAEGGGPVDSFERVAGRALAGAMAGLGGLAGAAGTAAARLGFEPAGLPAPLRDVFTAGFERGAAQHLTQTLAAALGQPQLAGQLGGAAAALVSGLPAALRDGLQAAGVAPQAAAAGAGTALPAVQSQLTQTALPPGLQALLGGIADGPAAFVRQSAAALGTSVSDVVGRIAGDPGRFVDNLLDAVGTGFQRFGGNVAQHLQEGVTGWTRERLGEAGIELPKSFDMKSLVGIAAELLGRTGEGVFALAERRLGPPLAAGKEGLEAVGRLAGETAEGLGRRLEGLARAGGEGAAAAQRFLGEVVGRAVGKLAGLIDPQAAAKTVAEAVLGVIGWVGDKAAAGAARGGEAAISVAELALRGTEWAAGKAEAGLAKAVPTAISFLAEVAGLGDLASRTGRVAEGVRGRVDALVEQAVTLGGDAAAGLGRFLGRQEARVLDVLSRGAGEAPELAGALGDLLDAQTRLIRAGGAEAVTALAEGKAALVDALRRGGGEALDAVARGTAAGQDAAQAVGRLADGLLDELSTLLGPVREHAGAASELQRREHEQSMAVIEHLRA